MFFEGVKLFCFGASYAAALGCEVATPVLGSSLRRGLSLGFTAAGVIAHSIYIGYRAIGVSVPPLTTNFDSLLVLSWVFAISFLSVRWYYPKVTLGVFALPVVVGLIALAASLGPDVRRDLQGLARIWGPVHGAILALGAFAVTVGFVAGVMYLVQVKRLKAKHLPSELLDLPSLELLERVNRQGITAAFTLLTVGLTLGLLLAIQQASAGQTEVRFFDPKVISAAVLWLAFGFLLQIRSQPQFRGRRVALLTILAFCLMLFTYVGVDLLLSSWHVSEA